MEGVDVLLSKYDLYKAEPDLTKKATLREEFFETLSIILIRCSFKKLPPIEAFKAIRKGIEERKVKELTDMQRAFDTIERIIF